MKRLTSIEKAQAVVKALNEFRIVFPSAFTCEQLTLQLKSINCPHSKSIFSVLNKTHQIKSVGVGQYVFTFSEPVYYKAIQAALDEVSDAQKMYQEKFTSKKVNTVVKPVKSVVNNNIEEAIALLKANGYKISKPIIVTTYEEI